MTFDKLFTSSAFKTDFLHVMPITRHKVVEGECFVLELLQG